MSYIYGLLKGAISALLHLMYSLTGNFGVAIILATIVIKIILPDGKRLQLFYINGKKTFFISISVLKHPLFK